VPVGSDTKTPATVKYSNANVEKIPEGSGSYLPGSVSIKEDVSEIKTETEVAEIFNSDSDEFRTALQIDTNALEEVWKELLTKVPDDQPDLKSTLATKVPSVDPGFVLHFEVSNQIQKGKVENFKPGLIPFIREKLKNRFITLNVIVNVDAVVESKPVSPTEKFNYLAGKNPVMIDLQKKFGLEPNY